MCKDYTEENLIHRGSLVVGFLANLWSPFTNTCVDNRCTQGVALNYLTWLTPRENHTIPHLLTTPSTWSLPNCWFWTLFKVTQEIQFLIRIMSNENKSVNRKNKSAAIHHGGFLARANLSRLNIINCINFRFPVLCCSQEAWQWPKFHQTTQSQAIRR